MKTTKRNRDKVKDSEESLSKAAFERERAKKAE
jgi:hypothetical protein